jgi:protein ImuB
VPEREPFALVDLSARAIVITAPNAAAAREGIVKGMALTDARAALPSLRARPGDRMEDARVLFRLSQWAGRYGPSRSHDGEDGFWCDVTGVTHLYGGEDALLQDLISRLARNRIPARAALASTYGGARALARYGIARDGDVACVPPGQIADALAPLPVEALRLDGATVLLLKRLGLKRIGDLNAIARISLAHRFESEEASSRVLLRLDQALGHQAEPLKPYCELAPVFVRRAFPEPLISSGPLEAIIDAMCDDIAQMLKERGEGTRALRLEFFRADGTCGVTGAMMRTFKNDAAHFKMLLRPRLAKIDAGFGIDLLSLQATETGPCADAQDGFAEECAAAYDPGPLIDALSNRLGQEAVTMAAPRASHIPERSEDYSPAIMNDPPDWQYLPTGGGFETVPDSKLIERGGVKKTAASSRSASGYVPSWPYGNGVSRPSFVLPRPEPIAVIAEVPDGPPARFTWRRVERRVARAQGPERIAPEWWRMIGRPAGAKSARARDYYQIEDEAGASYWVFRHGLYGSEEEAHDGPPAWFLHGLF